jgi:tripartite-type tricarboxylate transporter receptor subunit TctC
MMHRNYLFLFVIFHSVLCCLASASFAQSATNYPARPIRVLVPYPPGGGADILARTINTKLSVHLGQQIVIDNRAGGGGNLAHELAARAAPDGYTLLIAISAIVTNPAVNPRATYDPVRDFTPLTLIARSPYRVVIHPGLPATTMQEWVALAKARPGSMNYGSAGSGSAIQLSVELFRMQAGLTLTHVPYKGTAPAVTDLIAGQIQMMFAGTLSAAPHVKSGRIRALAVTSLTRRADAPELPTIAETVLPGFEAGEWFGVFAPAGLPSPLIAKLHAELMKTLNDPEVKERLIASGMDFVGSTPAALGDVIKRDYAKWTRVVKETGLKLD